MIVGYTSDILDDAKAFSTHAGKKSIDVEDTKLAVQLKLDKSYTNPPPRELLLGKKVYLSCIYTLVLLFGFSILYRVAFLWNTQLQNLFKKFVSFACCK